MMEHAQIVTRILRRRIERIVEDILVEIGNWKMSCIVNFVWVLL